MNGAGADDHRRLAKASVLDAQFRPVNGGGADDSRRLAKAWLLASIPTMVLFAWVLTAGNWNLFQRQYYDDFYDAQARALLDGHWDVPLEVVQSEGFAIGDEFHIYFGPLPALARMPLLLVTDRFDGRLTGISMLAAMAAFAVAAFRLNLALRAAVRKDAPVTRAECLATGVLAVAMLTGIPLWLGSQAIVHHEAELWGLSLGVAAFAALARWRLEPSLRRLAAVSVLTAAAISTRQSFGVGVLVALGLVAVVALVEWWQSRRRGARSTPTAAAAAAATSPWAFLAAGTLPVVVSIVPNIARFGHPFHVPFDRQIASQFPEWVRFREANGGSYFRLAFVPTTLLQYLRPDAFDLRSHFPWIDYPLGGPTAVGGVTIGPSAVSSSLPVTMPALSLLAAAGVVTLARWVWSRREEAWLSCLAVGAVAGSFGALSLGSITHRYIGDLYPAVLILSLVGFHAIARWAWQAVAEDRTSGRRRIIGSLAAGLAVALVGLGALINSLLALEYQRERSVLVPDTWRAEWVRMRADLPGGDRPSHLALDERLPATAPDGSMVVVGDCDALYLRVEDLWLAVERGEAVGVYDIRVNLNDLEGLPEGNRAPLLTMGEGPAETTVAVSRSGGYTDVAVWTAATGRWAIAIHRVLDGAVTFRINGDPRRVINPMVIHHAEQPYEIPVPGGTSAPTRVGQADAAPHVLDQFPGTVTRRSRDRSTCLAVDR